ncbi:hypothetical protein LFLT20_02960 [Limosilactobacillus fermentum]|nr:hypothetical protein ikematsu_02900 [Limosilactobacillus fermentum]GIC73292.1 hypothetical protein LFLT20_02960 [Limosilactobacillus fermentum]
MSALQLVWFILIAVLFSGFFFLDGFDYGVGMAVKTLATNDEERTQVIQTIGPVWDGNEVWLITAGGPCLPPSRTGTLPCSPVTTWCSCSFWLA